MKTLLAVLSLFLAVLAARSQGTAFTYQGRLNNGGSPASGIYDLRFAIYDSTNSPGNLIAGPLTNSATAVSNGLFTVTLDFGPGVFTGADRWLQLEVRTNGADIFTTLLPLQPIQPVPYAIMANSASNLLGTLPAAQLSGTLPATQLAGTLSSAQLPATVLTNGASGVNITGTFAGNGAGITNVSGTLIWQTVGETNQLAQPNANFLLTNPAPSTITLPGAASVGDVVRVSGAGAGGWQVIPNLGQSITGYSAVLSLGETWTPYGDPSQAWYGLAADYDGSTLIAVGSYSGQIAVSHDYGTNWITRGAVSYWPAAVTSADGNHLAVFQQFGQIYTSSDGGSNWVARGISRQWSTLASSADGAQLAATVSGGQIYVSTDAGVTWTARDQNRSWGGIAMSADGSKLAATVTGGQIYTSTDGGTNWTARESNRNWSVIASSADGCKLLAGTGGGNLYTSTDSGVTWMPKGSTGNWAYVASSADGNRLMANDHGDPSSIYVSADAGVTWSVRETPRSYWRQVAVSGDGKVLAAEVDRGYIYVSRETLSGTPVAGAQGTTATLQYVGHGVWQPLNEALIGPGSVGTTQLASNLTISGLFTAAHFAGDGSGLTNLVMPELPPGILTNNQSGVILTGLFSGDGGGLTNIPASAVVTAPPGMALIPAGSFTMGNSIGDSDITDANPTNVTVSAFYMDVNLVSYSQWLSVYFWATNHGYGFVHAGSGKAANHPVQTVDWYDTVKWSNARSQQAGKTPVYYTDTGLTQVYTNGEVTVYVDWVARGYRLPTEAEWEKAARGGRSNQRFPWGNTITENLANYYGDTADYSYDLGPNGYNSIGSIGGTPYTSPVGSFAPNGYGLNDMAGNVFEWCWDWYGTYAGGSDPRGPASGSARMLRGGYWNLNAFSARCAFRVVSYPVDAYDAYFGFRCVRGL